MECGTEPERTMTGIGMALSHEYQYSCHGSGTDSQTISSPISLHACLSGRHFLSISEERGLENGDWSSRSLWREYSKLL